MHEKLIDDENYPRSDIDVYTVRVARNRIICEAMSLICNFVLVCLIFGKIMAFYDTC